MANYQEGTAARIIDVALKGAARGRQGSSKSRSLAKLAALGLTTDDLKALGLGGNE